MLSVPEATCIVDLYHARKHLHSLTRSLEFMLGSRKDEWLAARLEDLDYGYIDGIAADPSHSPAPARAGARNPDARIADGSVTDTRRGNLL